MVPVFALMIILTGLSAYYVGRQNVARNAQSHSQSDEYHSESHFDDSRIEQSLLKIEQRLSALELHQVEAIEKATAPAESNSTKPMPAATELTQVDDPSAEERSEIERRLATEKRDRSWSTSAEDQIRVVAASVAANVQYSITSMQCLTSICNVKMSVSGNAQHQFYSFPFSVKGMGGFHTSTPKQLPDGSYSLEYVFFRAGYVPGREEAK